MAKVFRHHIVTATAALAKQYVMTSQTVYKNAAVWNIVTANNPLDFFLLRQKNICVPLRTDIADNEAEQ